MILYDIEVYSCARVARCMQEHFSGMGTTTSSLLKWLFLFGGELWRFFEQIC